MRSNNRVNPDALRRRLRAPFGDTRWRLHVRIYGVAKWNSKSS
jgi:hypothetical protein